MLTTLAIVIAILIGAMVLLKKYFYRSPGLAGGNAMIRTLSSYSLGPKNSILLVDVLGQVLLLGISDHQMSLLTAITDPGAIERLRSLSNQGGFPPMSDPLSRCKSLLQSINRTRKEG
jgi:flagellar protein FliO/FliZ